MKKAFTLSETLITLVLLGVIMAITIPAVNSIRPDKDLIMYQKAFYNLNGALDGVMQDYMVYGKINYWADNSIPASGFCDTFVKYMNINGESNCTEESSYENPNFVTNDGISYWGFEGKKFSIGGASDDDQKVSKRVIYIERELSKNELKESYLTRTRGSDYKTPGLKIYIAYNGKISTDENWTYEMELIKKFGGRTDGYDETNSSSK